MKKVSFTANHKKKGLSRVLMLAILLLACVQVSRAARYDVAAFLYPAYCADDPRLRPFWPMGMGEWETVMTMQQRHPGHPGTGLPYGVISTRPTLL